LAAEYARRGDPTGRFDVLYKESEEGQSIVPSADCKLNPGLVECWNGHAELVDARQALVIAGSLGDHTEQLAAWGFTTTALNIFEKAIRTARKRFPKSEVNVAAFVRPEGKLLAIVRGRESDEPEGELPVPLTRAEMNEFVRASRKKASRLRRLL
jgi:hypothetical protein